MTGHLVQKLSGVTKGSTNNTRTQREITDITDSNNTRVACVEHNYDVGGSSRLGLYVYNTMSDSDNSYGSIVLGCNSSGDFYTTAPTPATNDNSTKIATTAFVNSRINSVETVTIEYETGFGPYSNNASRKPTFYKWGHFIMLVGVATPTVDTSSDGGALCTAPSGYRPPKDVYQLCQGSGKTWWLMTVTTGGLVTCARYGNGEYQSSISAGAWMPFTITYYVA